MFWLRFKFFLLVNTGVQFHRSHNTFAPPPRIPQLRFQRSHLISHTLRLHSALVYALTPSKIINAETVGKLNHQNMQDRGNPGCPGSRVLFLEFCLGIRITLKRHLYHRLLCRETMHLPLSYGLKNNNHFTIKKQNNNLQWKNTTFFLCFIFFRIYI